MGRDKLPLEVGGVSLFCRVRHALAPHCAEVLAVGGEPGPRVPPGVRPVPDRRAGREGPLAGIEAGLAAARCPYVFVAAGDMPFLPERLVGSLLSRLRLGAVAAVPRYGGRVHPLCAAYDRDILAEVSAALDGGERAVRRFLRRLEVEYVGEGELHRFGDPERFLLNVNSPEDLDRARSEADGRPADG